MDELIHVALLRRDLQAEVSLDLAEPARRLDAEISAAAGAGAGRPAAAARRRYRYRRPLAIAGGVLGAAAVGALVVGQSLPGGAAPSPAGPAQHPAAAAPGLAATAAQFVAYAMKAASTTTFDPAPNQWVYRKVEDDGPANPAHQGAPGTPSKPISFERWLSGDFQRSAGNDTGQLVIGRSSWTAGVQLDGWPQLTFPTSYKFFNSLPTDPAALTQLIASANKVDATTVAGGTVIFNAVQGLMQSFVLPPQLDAAFYGVLAKLPGVTFDSSVKDLSGRTDAGFSITREGYFKDEIMVSPTTFAYLGLQDIAVADHTNVALDGTYHIVPGQILAWQAVLASGIVDQAGQRP
jgi:hypothetical protein